MKLAELGDQVTVLMADCIADARCAGDTRRGLTGALNGMIHAFENRACLAQKDLTHGRERNRTRLAVNQLCANGLFQPLYLLGDGGLGQEILFRRLGEALYSATAIKYFSWLRFIQSPAIISIELILTYKITAGQRSQRENAATCSRNRTELWLYYKFSLLYYKNIEFVIMHGVVYNFNRIKASGKE